MSLLTWKLGLEIFHLHQFSGLQWISTQLQREGRVAFILLGSLMSSAMEFASSCLQAFNSEQMFLLFVKKLLILLLPEPSLWCYSQKWKWRCLISLWAIAKLWSQGNKQCAGEMGLSSYRTATSRILFIFLLIQCCSPDSLRFPLKLHAIPNSLPRVQAHSLMLAERLWVKEVLSVRLSSGAGVGWRGIDEQLLPLRMQSSLPPLHGLYKLKWGVWSFYFFSSCLHIKMCPLCGKPCLTSTEHSMSFWGLQSRLAWLATVLGAVGSLSNVSVLYHEFKSATRCSCTSSSSITMPLASFSPELPVHQWKGHLGTTLAKSSKTPLYLAFSSQWISKPARGHIKLKQVSPQWLHFGSYI